MGGWKPLRVCNSSLSSHGPFHVPGSILRPSGFRPRRSIQLFHHAFTGRWSPRYRAVFPGVIFLYQSFRQKAKLLLTLVRQLSILTLRAGNTTTAQRLRAEGRGKYLGAKLPGGREQSEARRTQELSQPVERTNEAHIGGWLRQDQIRPHRPHRVGGRITAQRSVTSADGFSVKPTTKLDGD